MLDRVSAEFEVGRGYDFNVRGPHENSSLGYVSREDLMEEFGGLGISIIPRISEAKIECRLGDEGKDSTIRYDQIPEEDVNIKQLILAGHYGERDIEIVLTDLPMGEVGVKVSMEARRWKETGIVGKIERSSPGKDG